MVVLWEVVWWEGWALEFHWSLEAQQVQQISRLRRLVYRVLLFRSLRRLRIVGDLEPSEGIRCGIRIAKGTLGNRGSA